MLLLSIPALAARASSLQHTADHELEARLARCATHTFAWTLVLSVHASKPFLPPFTHCLLCRACMHLWEAQASDMLLPTLAASVTEDEAMLPANSTADYKASTPPAFINKHTMAVAMQQREVGTQQIGFSI